MDYRLSILAKACFIVGTLLIIPLAAQGKPVSISSTYPQFRLAPVQPTTQDSVSFWLVEGKSNLTCYPRYATSFSSSTSGGYFLIRIRYQELMLGIACMVMTDTVEYGPKFNFGKLQVGNYIIVDSLTNLSLDTFSVMPSPLSRDSVTVTPDSPTAMDSLDFLLFGANLSCAGTVYNDTVLLVNDTCIYLSFSYEECTACDCLSMGRWIPFHSKPLKAGTYGIYDAQIPYCPQGAVCFLPAIIPVRVGQVTVHASAAVVGGMVNASDHPTTSFERSSSILKFSLPMAQFVTLEIYRLNGQKIATLLKGEQCGPGTYRIPLNKFTTVSGCIIAKLKTGRAISLVPITLLR
jgi:hypothetical protein